MTFFMWLESAEIVMEKGYTVQLGPISKDHIFQNKVFVPCPVARGD